MDSSDDELILLAGACIVGMQSGAKKSKRKPQVRVNPYLEQRFTKGRFELDVRLAYKWCI